MMIAVALLGLALAACSSQGSSQSADSSGAPSASASAQDAASSSRGAEAYVGTWVSGRASLEISAVDDHYKCSVTWGASVDESAQWDYEPCLYDGESLTCEGLGVKKDVVYNEDGSVKSSEEEFSDGSASFTIGDDGKLTWIDFKVYPEEEGLVFERAE